MTIDAPNPDSRPPTPDSPPLTPDSRPASKSQEPWFAARPTATPDSRAPTARSLASGENLEDFSAARRNSCCVQVFNIYGTIVSCQEWHLKLIRVAMIMRYVR